MNQISYPRILGVLLALALAWTLAGNVAEAVVIPGSSVSGTVQWSDRTYTCTASGTCNACSSPANSNPFGLHFGSTGGNGVNSRGTVAGVITVQARINGTTIPSELLPTNAYYRSAMRRIASFCGDYCGQGCDSTPLTYWIGSQTGNVPKASSDAGYFINVPTGELVGGVDFRFDFCNSSLVWGRACGQVGTLGYDWKLHGPATFAYATVPAGNPQPIGFGTSGVTIDFSSAPGGLCTATRQSGAPNPPQAGVLEGAGSGGPELLLPAHWDIRTNMDAITGTLTIDYSGLTIPVDMEESEMSVFRYVANGFWEELVTAIDPVEDKATAEAITELGIFCIGQYKTVPTESSTWGQLKKTFDGN